MAAPAQGQGRAFLPYRERHIHRDADNERTEILARRCSVEVTLTQWILISIPVTLLNRLS